MAVHLNPNDTRADFLPDCRKRLTCWAILMSSKIFSILIAEAGFIVNILDTRVFFNLKRIQASCGFKLFSLFNTRVNERLYKWIDILA
jgi:hypothetical protein